MNQQIDITRGIMSKDDIVGGGDEKLDSIQTARALGGLATTFTLLAHFIHPALPFTPIRIQLLLLLIAILLELDQITHITISIIGTGGDNNGS